MKKIWISLIYVGFFALIAFAVYYTKSATPLWALLLAPSFKWTSKDKSNKKNNDKTTIHKKV